MRSMQEILERLEFVRLQEKEIASDLRDVLMEDITTESTERLNTLRFRRHVLIGEYKTLLWVLLFNEKNQIV